MTCWLDVHVHVLLKHSFFCHGPCFLYIIKIELHLDFNLYMHVLFTDVAVLSCVSRVTMWWTWRTCHQAPPSHSVSLSSPWPWLSQDRGMGGGRGCRVSTCTPPPQHMCIFLVKPTIHKPLMTLALIHVCDFCVKIDRHRFVGFVKNNSKTARL